MWRHVAVVPLFVGLALEPAYGQASDPENRSEAVGLRGLVRELLQNNPEIRAARFRYEAITKRPTQAGTLPDPKVTFANVGVGHPLSRLNASDFAYYGLGISQEVPFPGKLSLAAEEARKEAQSAEAEYEATVLDKIAQLKLAFYDWYYLSKALEITRKNLDLLDRFEKIARARYSVGKGILPDVLKAQVEYSGLSQQLELLEQRLATAETRIQTLIERPVEKPLGRPADVTLSPLEMSLESVLSALEESAPELRSRQFLIESRAVGVNRARKEYRPDFNFSFQWQRTGTRFPDYYMAVAEVKLPVYFWRKQRYGVEEAVARLRESRANYRTAQQDLVFTAKDQYLTAKTSERVLDLYRAGVIPQASLSLESNVAAYEVGNIDFLTLLNSMTTLLSFEMEYYEELARHEQALARLEPLVGRELTTF
ncbi:MAG: TolC family protein [Bryobacteraceae bacterium]